ncbi:Acetyl esterase [Staphylococcus aureus]|uniref:Acetyl esterase n=1 Tax=Staphylococcus aureus TaxID=1280 RepID=A0A380DNW6_STAAU|nr:Acetyl esterase [Staphylococcus aureus]
MLEFKAGKINKHVLYSDILNRDVTLSIYLPESYNQLVKYNVILCFDGLDFLRFGRIQRTYESLIKEARIDDAIMSDSIMKTLISVERNFIHKEVVLI